MRIACIVLALFLALPSPGWSTEAMPSAEPKSEGPADMSWFFARYGATTFFSGRVFRLEEFSPGEFVTLVEAWRNGSEFVGAIIRDVLFPYLRSHPDDSRLSSVRRVVSSTEFAHSVLRKYGAGCSDLEKECMAWFMEFYPRTFWDKRALVDMIVAGDVGLGTARGFCSRSILSFADVPPDDWNRAVDIALGPARFNYHPVYALLDGLAYPRLRASPGDVSLDALRGRLCTEEFVFRQTYWYAAGILGVLPPGWWTARRIIEYGKMPDVGFEQIGRIGQLGPDARARFQLGDVDTLMRMVQEGSANAYWILHILVSAQAREVPEDPASKAFAARFYSEEFVMSMVRLGRGGVIPDSLPSGWWDSRRIMRVLEEYPNADLPHFDSFLARVCTPECLSPEDFGRLVDAVAKKQVLSFQAALSTMLKGRLARRPVQNGDAGWQARALSPSFVNTLLLRGCYWILGCLPDGWMTSAMAKKWIEDPAVDMIAFYWQLPKGARMDPVLALASVRRCDGDRCYGHGQDLLSSFPDSRAVTVAVVSRWGTLLEHAHARWRDDDGAVAAAVGNTRCSLAYASSRLKRKYKWSDTECAEE